MLLDVQGRWRSGLGVETVFEIGSDDTHLVIFGDGDREPAFGLFGGGDGSLNSIARCRYYRDRNEASYES